MIYLLLTILSPISRVFNHHQDTTLPTFPKSIKYTCDSEIILIRYSNFSVQSFHRVTYFTLENPQWIFLSFFFLPLQDTSKLLYKYEKFSLSSSQDRKYRNFFYLGTQLIFKDISNMPGFVMNYALFQIFIISLLSLKYVL